MEGMGMSPSQEQYHAGAKEQAKLNDDRNLINKLLLQKAPLDMMDVVRIDAELENKAFDALKDDPDNIELKENLDRIRNSDIVKYKKDEAYLSVPFNTYFVKGTVDGKKVDFWKNSSGKFGGTINGEVLSPADAEDLYKKYEPIVAERLKAQREKAKENSN